MRTLILGSLRLLLVSVLLYVSLFAVLFTVELDGLPLVYRTSRTLAWKGGSSHARFHEYDPAVRHDVVVVGSSHAYRGYDPRWFGREGLSCFNLGSTAQTPLCSWPIVKHWLTRHNTGLLVLDIYEAMLENSGMEGAIDLTQNISDGRIAAHLAWNTRDPRAMNMLLLRWATRAEPVRHRENGYVGRGYCTRSDTLTGPVDYPSGGVFRPDARQVAYLDRIVEHCREAGIPLVLVTHPMPRAGDRLKHERFAAWLRAHLGPGGPPYLDFATGHPLDDRRHFYDANHMNQAGVDLFMPMLIERLRREGALPGAAGGDRFTIP